VATGTYPITVTATGIGFTTTTTVSLTVGLPSLTLSAPPVTVLQGGSGTDLITSTTGGGFNSAVSLNAWAQNDNFYVDFINPVSFAAPGSGSAVVTVLASSTIAPGTYPPIIVSAIGGGITQSITVPVTVEGVTLTTLPTSLTILPGSNNTFTISTTSAYGFNSAVSLTLSGQPTGVTASFSPTFIGAPGSGSSTMTLTVASTTLPGTYPITVTATGGGITATTIVSLTVPQVITFANPGTQTIGTPVPALVATDNAALPVTFTSASVSVCTVSGTYGTTITLVAIGTCVINANQYGNSQYSAAQQVQQSFTVNGEPQTISFSAPVSVTYGVAPIALAPTATSGLVVTLAASPLTTCTISVTTLTITGAGSCTITANQTGNSQYSAALAVTKTVTVNPATLTVTVNNATRVYGAANPTFTANYSGFVNGDTSAVLSSAPSLTTLAGIHSSTGTYSITAAGGAAANYSFTYVPGTLTVSPNLIAIPAAGNINTVAGSGTVCAGKTDNVGDNCLAQNANLAYPTGAVVDPAGNLYIADMYHHRIRMVSSLTGDITMVAGNGTAGYSGDGGAATSAELNEPWNIALDSSGNLYIADWGNYCIRKVSATTKLISTVAGICTQSGFSGDGGPAVSANLSSDQGIALDSFGNLYIADNQRIRMINATTGTISTVVGTSIGFGGDGGPAASAHLYNPSGIVVDSSNNLYIADSGNNRIREVTAPISTGTGIITTVAGNGNIGYSGDGGPATSAEFWYPTGVGVDGSGNIYVLTGRDSAAINMTANCGLRKVIAATGNIYTVAGNGTCAYSGDGGPATSAEMISSYAVSVVVDLLGNIYFADESSGRIRAIGGSNTLTPTITWSDPAPIPSGTPLSPTQLNAVVSANGGPAATCVYTPAAGTVLAIGKYTLSVTCTPIGTTVYSPATATVPLTVITNSPAIVWDTPTTIPQGTIVGGTQLFATVIGIPGTFTYTPAVGTALTSIGTQTVSVTFTPTNKTLYSTVTSSATFTIIPDLPIITWNAPESIIRGTALSITQLNATANVPGTFTYTPGSGAVLGAGPQILSVRFTPTSGYQIITAEVTLNVNKIIPVITWPTPANINDTTPLGSTQLNAKSSVTSTYVYSPAAGTTLLPGDQMLTVTVKPNDVADYATVTATVPISVITGTKADSRTVQLFVNGSTNLIASYPYGASDTPSTVAEGLAASASSPLVTVKAVDNALYIDANTTGSASYSLSVVSNANTNTTLFPQPSFSISPSNGELVGGAPNGPGGIVYQYTVPTGGYDPAGNLLSYTDNVMGTWGFSYDTLNRLVSATDNESGNPNTNYCWAYDDFGNRLQQAGSNAAFTNAKGAAACTAATNASFTNSWASYNANNQITGSPQAAGGLAYDPAGDVTNDGQNRYLYDAEGRICAVYSNPIAGVPAMTGYLYDADGTRVAKGNITAWSCDPTLSGFHTTNDYILGLGGEQLTEMGVDTTAGSSTNTLTWQHTNVWAGGKLLGTYDNAGLHFYFDDPLGTRRAQTDSAGVLEETCSSQPFGDALNCVNPSQSTYFISLVSPTEHHFTGKERDSESGNDYFGARYYASSMGRWLSPDWSAKEEPVPYAKLDNPQSLNLYSYVWNNPLARSDPDGHATKCTGSGTSAQCITTADTYDAAHSNHQTTLASPEVKAAAEAGKDKVSAQLAPHEKLGFIEPGKGGKLEVKPVVGDPSASANGTSVTVKTPADAVAAIHGHDKNSNGMVDSPSLNRGLGDSQPLTQGLPNATVSNGQVGWHEINDGQLQFTAPQGAVTPAQQTLIQNNLNTEQQQFQQ
jgi:RHS repeat-associated protein